MKAAEINELLDIQCSTLNQALSECEDTKNSRKAYRRYNFIDNLKSLVQERISVQNQSSLDGAFVDSISLNQSLGRGFNYDEYSKATKYINETLFDKFSEDFNLIRPSFHAALNKQGVNHSIVVSKKQGNSGTIWGFELEPISPLPDNSETVSSSKPMFYDESPSVKLLPEKNKLNFLMRFICPLSYIYLVFIGTILGLNYLLGSISFILMDWFILKLLRPWIEAYISGSSIAPFYLNKPKYAALVRLENIESPEKNWIYKTQRNLELVQSISDCPIPNCGGKLLPKQKSLFSFGELKAVCTNNEKQHTFECDLHSRVR